MFIKLSLEPLLQSHLLSKFAAEEQTRLSFFVFIAAFNWTDCRPRHRAD